MDVGFEHTGVFPMSSRNINPLKVALLDHISRLIHCLVNIKDETGEFLMTLKDGRVIDTKGWNDWEVRLRAVEYA
jgi:unsaturated rhamnogalacturonyl hydrolase